MSDPHIDIDDIDNSTTSGGEIPGGIPGATDQTADYDASSVFNSMMRQFQRWGNDFTLLPPETARHLRASQREFLLAWRSLIDNSLERLERQELRDQLRQEANNDFSGSMGEKIQVEEIDG